VGPEGQQVFVVKPDKRVEVRPVTVARTSEGEAVIAKGIQVGEQVVREGQFLLGPGARVEIKESGGAPETKGRKREGAEGSKSKAPERSES
jgi:multidrug efflux system membrane fusion protein